METFFVPKTVGDTVCLGISVGFSYFFVSDKTTVEFSLVSFMVKNVINHCRKKVGKLGSVKEVVLLELPNNNQAVQSGIYEGV